jgi:ABC-type uncharacterized transport system substrate-binding protein
MRRREFITLVAGAGLFCVTNARRAGAEQATMPVIGFLRSTTLADAPHYVTAFRHGLKEAGFVVGQNVAIEYRWAEGRLDRLPALVADLVRQQVALIVGNTPSALAAKAATTTVPIVFVTGGDPVIDGFVASLSRPGGNVTGVSFLSAAIVTKRLELLRELVPKALPIAVLGKPKLSSSRKRGESSAGRSAINRTGTHCYRSRQRSRHRGGLRNIRSTWSWCGVCRQWRIPALPKGTAYCARSPIQTSRELCLARLRRGRRSDELRNELHRCIPPGRYICWPHSQGRKPADLPVQQSTKFEFVLNLKTAKALGLDVPDKVLALSDEVIE